MKRATATLISVVLLLATASPGQALAENVAGPIRLIPENSESYTRLDAKFAPKPDVCPARQPRNLHAAYSGTLEIGRRSDGHLYLVSELDFPRYLRGIAEVPRNWAIEALKAQVVAARTYAAGHMNPKDALARELNYNLCATDACQVYRGLVVERGAWGDAWKQAVDETAGEILEYQGKPAGTFYFSTSDGRTRTNAESFGGPPLPYLLSVAETDDTESPLSNWTVRMNLQDLTESLRAAGSWAGGQIEKVAKRGETIDISGSGTSTAIAVDKFRIQLNLYAVCLIPKRYPTPSTTGRPLPQVVPSKWFELQQEGNEFLMTGRGWGHGVGMVQWGAKGKADKGMPYPEILAFYYGGLRPVKRAEPGAIRVGLAIDIEEVTIERVGAVRVDGAQALPGPMRLAAGPSISIAKGSVISPLLKIDKVWASGPAVPSTPVVFAFELSDPANVRIRYRGPASGESASEPRDRGAQKINWEVASLPSGTYEAEVVASDGVDEVVSTTVPIAVAAPSPSPTISSPPASSAKPTPRSTQRPLLLIVGLILLVAATAVLAARIKTRRAL